MKTFFITILFFIVTFHCNAQLEVINLAGYTGKSSYRYGDTVTFYTKSVINANITSFELKDLSNNSLFPSVTINGFDPTDQPNLPNPTNDPWENGYNYVPTCTTWTVPVSLASGYYMLDNKIPVIIKGDKATADIVIVCPTNTINAYTESDGANNNTGSLYHTNRTIVSFHRPQSRGNYSNCDDGFLDWIRTWNATLTTPYKLNFISDMDLDDSITGWDEIQNAKLIIVPSHSEYWTRGARINFDKFVDAGKNALILSGNTMWVQVRYQNDPTNPDNPQMVCYRGSNWCDPTGSTGCFQEDNYISNHPLQRTYHWGEPDLKYSIIGSIGSDSWNGGYGNSSCSSCGGSYPFASGGFRILQSPSPFPFMNGPVYTGITFSHAGNYDIIPLSSSPSDEFDGTLVIRDGNGQALDVNNHVIPDISSPNLDNYNYDPQLDLAALGFYRAEMVGYHRNTTKHYLNTTNNPLPDPQDWNNTNVKRQNSFCPFMVFQKTNTSGIVINVNSNRWCYNDNNNDWTTNANTALRPRITANMISLLYNNVLSPSNSNYKVFSTPTPTSPYIVLKPEYSNVTYLACKDGSIHITPTGIFLTNAYKVDDGWVRNIDHSGGNTPFMKEENSFINVARIDNNCNSYSPLRISHIVANNYDSKKQIEQSDGFDYSIYPNPTSGKFKLQMLNEDNSEMNIYVINSINQEVFRKERYSGEIADIDLSSYSKGIYFVRIVAGEKTVTKMIVVT